MTNAPAQRLPVTAALTELGGLRLADTSTEAMLARVVQLAVRTVPGCDDASITLLTDDGPRTPVAVGDRAAAIDAEQYQRGYGPCLDAADAGEGALLDDAHTATPWPEVAEALRAHGLRSVASTSLPLHAGLSGALNVYSEQPSVFDAEARRILGVLAAYAGAALSNAEEYATARELAEAGGAALTERAAVEQAKGILMHRHGCSAQEAFLQLAAEAQRQCARLRTVAERLVLSVTAAADAPRP